MWCVSDTGDQDARQYVPNTPFDESKILCRDHKLKKKIKMSVVRHNTLHPQAEDKIVHYTKENSYSRIPEKLSTKFSNYL